MLERGAMSAYDPKRTFWRRLTVRHRQADQNRSCGRLISDLSGRAMRTQGNTFPYVPHQLSIAKELVLPVRIELTTSPLPRECSTTELRQHNSGTTTGEITLRSRRDPCHRGYAHASELPRRLRSRPLHGSCHGSWHGSCHALSFRMAKLGKPGGKAAQHAARKARLAAALRENLKRRKQQARARAQAPEAAISEPRKEPDRN